MSLSSQIRGEFQCRGSSRRIREEYGLLRGSSRSGLNSLILCYHFQHGEIGESFFCPGRLAKTSIKLGSPQLPSDGQMTVRISYSQDAMNSDFHVRERGTAVGITYPRGSPRILSTSRAARVQGLRGAEPDSSRQDATHTLFSP